MEQARIKLQKQFDKMCKTGKLFRVNVTGDTIWDIYLNSFKSEDNPVFRDPESSVHNCRHCKNFIRRYGNIVAINDEGKLMSIFDVKNTGQYQKSFNKMCKVITSSYIDNVFFETFDSLNNLPYESCKKSFTEFKLGIPKNTKQYSPEEAAKYGVVKSKEIRTFNHMSLIVPEQFVNKTGLSIEAIMADYRQANQVFERGMQEIPLNILKLVKDLINQGSLLNGEAHLHKVEKIIPYKEEYDNVASSIKSTWCWLNSYKLPFAKFKNELIGVLCTELAEGDDLNVACLKWNKRVDPANYMKATAPITQNQIDEAQKFVENNGYVESFSRRVAVIEDIKVSEIKHINAGEGKIKNVSMFDTIKSTKSSSKINEFKGVEEVSIINFMKNILPHCTKVEAYLENKHEGNLVTMTTSSEDSKQIFKWNNPYSWTYNGNLAGKSMIKDNVSKVGGNIQALVRASLQWNDKDTSGIVDFDLHCKGHNHIYYSNRGKTHSCGGHLDVDMIDPSKIGIENITWKNKINDGTYQILVHNFNGGSNKGFKVEIEFDNETYNYHVEGRVTGTVQVATIKVVNGKISITHHLPETNSSKELYSLNTKEFHEVNLMCLSPNYWDGNSVGNKHYFFMLKDCKSSTSLRGFHIENLLPDLTKYRKVLEVLGSTNMIEPANNQLSGLGFNATVRDEVILKLEGNFKRVIKVKF